MACDYCYYLEKSKLYPNNPRHVMSDELLERFTRDYIAMQTTPEVLFTWHGGETLMRPISFYKKALELQKSMPAGTPSATQSRPTVPSSPVTGLNFSKKQLSRRPIIRRTGRVSRRIPPHA